MTTAYDLNAPFSSAEFKRVKSVQFTVFDADTIVGYSVAEVLHLDIYKDGEPIRNGINDPRLGPLDPRSLCESCGLGIKEACPLCIDTLNEDEITFFACLCRYQVCLVCVDYIQRQMNGKCPNCRKDYNESTFRCETSGVKRRAKKSDKKKEKASKKPDPAEAAKAAKASFNVAATAARNLGGFVPNRIFVGGVPITCSEEQFKAYFEPYGPISKVELQALRGFGYITYEQVEAADACLEHYNDHLLCKRWVEVKKSIPRELTDSYEREQRRLHAEQLAAEGGGDASVGATKPPKADPGAPFRPPQPDYVPSLPKTRIKQVKSSWASQDPHQLSVTANDFVDVWVDTESGLGWIYAERWSGGEKPMGWLPVCVLEKLPDSRQKWMSAKQRWDGEGVSMCSVEEGTVVLVWTWTTTSEGWTYVEMDDPQTGTKKQGWLPVVCLDWNEGPGIPRSRIPSSAVFGTTAPPALVTPTPFDSAVGSTGTGAVPQPGSDTGSVLLHR